MKILRQEFIFGEPLPTPECHASTIIVREDGRKLAAWFAGTKEANPDVLIFVSSFDGNTWSAPRAVTPEVGIQHWNPVLFEMNGEVVLFYKMGYPIADWHTRYITSKDFGETWSELGIDMMTVGADWNFVFDAAKNTRKLLQQYHMEA